MTADLRLGMITPSSNTILEPMTAEILAEVPEISFHAARIRVTEISLGDGSVGQFDDSPMLAAADMLADAKVSAICWNGTSASWLGGERDRQLVQRIGETIGVPGSSAVLSTLDAMGALGETKYGLVTPYIPTVQQRIVENFVAEGLSCVSERHLDISENFAFAEVSEATVEKMIREVAAEGAKVVIVLCTNVAGARLAERLERELDIVLLDSVSVSLWGALNAAGSEQGKRLTGWGRLFSL